MSGHIPSRPPVFGGGALFLFLLLLSAGCSQMITIPRTVEPAQAWNMMRMNSRNPDMVVIDVRTEEEYDREHIPRAINLNVQSSSFRRDIEPLNRDKTYILYCRAGNRSAEAMEIMNGAGFGKVAIIVGGFNAWRDSGLRTVNSLDEM